MLSVASCDKTTAPEPRELATLVGHSDLDPRIGTSLTGRSLQVTMLTYAGICDERASTAVVVNGMDVLIVPYNTSRGCPERTVKHVEHRVSIEFAASGTATLRIRGLDFTDRSVPPDTVVIERRIDVP